MSNRNHLLVGSSIRSSSLYCLRESHQIILCLNFTVEACSVKMLGMCHHHTFQLKFGISIIIKPLSGKFHFSKAIMMLELRFLFVKHSFHLLKNSLYYVLLVSLSKKLVSFSINYFQTFLYLYKII